jgi:SAM-dependent methyltransferase
MDAKTIRRGRLYDELAYLWPVLSPPDDYVMEARIWHAILREKLGPGRRRILELGAGAGHNLSHLASEFDFSVVDASEPMLDLLAQSNPSVERRQGDMRTVRLGRKFAAVLIHDAIGYMLTPIDLRAALATAFEHLEPGGVFITCPDFFRESFSDPTVEHYTRSKDNIELTYVEYTYDPDPADTTIESVMIFFVRRNGRLQIELDRHVFGLFPIATWISLMDDVGFAVEVRRCPVEGQDTVLTFLIGVPQQGND